MRHFGHRVLAVILKCLSFWEAVMYSHHDALEVLCAGLTNAPGATGPACYLDQLSLGDADDRLDDAAFVGAALAQFSIAKPLVRLLTDLTGPVRRKVISHRGADDTGHQATGFHRRPR